MGVEPKNRGILPPKWMVKISWFQPYEQMDDLGVLGGHPSARWLSPK